MIEEDNWIIAILDCDDERWFKELYGNIETSKEIKNVKNELLKICAIFNDTSNININDGNSCNCNNYFK